MAYRYFATPARKFIIGDAPGHEQYTRNMVTAASSADAAVVLVDATKLDWQNAGLELLPQTRRHSLLANLLRVPSIVFAVNKLDAVEDAAAGLRPTSAARWQRFTAAAGIAVARRRADLGAEGPQRGRRRSRAGAATRARRCCSCWNSCRRHRRPKPTKPFAFPVQWVEKFSASADTSPGPPRVLGPRGHRAACEPGQARHGAAQRPDRHGGPGAGPRAPARATCRPATAPASCSTAKWTSRAATGCWRPSAFDAVARALRHRRLARRRAAGRRAASTGRCTATAGSRPRSSASCTSWTSTRWPKQDADQLEPNAIGHVELALQEPLATLPYARSRALGSLVLVDTATHKTSGAVLVR